MRSSAPFVPTDRSRSFKAFTLGVLAIIALGVAGCSESTAPAASPSLGVFNATVTGATQYSVQGQSAVFYVPASANAGASYMLLMRDTTSGVAFAVEWDNVTGLTAGSTNVGVNDGQVVALYSDPAGTPFDGTTGTVTVSAATPDGAASGSFSLTATSRDGASTVTVNGTFKDAPIVLNPGN